MPFEVTSGSDRRDLLAEIEDFASTYGWTTEYDDIVSSGQLALSNSNCHVALTDTGTTSQTDAVNGGSVTDGHITAALATSINTGNQNFHGHPGSIVTSAGDGDRVITNDLAASLSNIYLFTDAAETYVHCVVQNASNRYTFFSFGNLDKKGMTHADIGYLLGCNYTWWPNVATFAANSNYGPNNIGFTSHALGHIFSPGNVLVTFGSAANIHIPSGVLDTVLGFSSGVQMVTAANIHEPVGVVSSVRPDGLAPASVSGIMSNAARIMNSSATGGAPLWPVPVIYLAGLAEASLSCYLGEIPDVAYVNMQGFAAKDIVTYGSDDWQLFPIKALGDIEETTHGNSPASPANTAQYGIAIKRIPNP